MLKIEDKSYLIPLNEQEIENEMDIGTVEEASALMEQFYSA